MALTADEVIVSLKARTGEYERGIQRADRVSSRAFNNMGDASLQMERQNALAMRGVSREANNMAGNVARALATVGVLLVGKEVLDYEEAWRNATNTMRQYSDVMGDANQATSDLNALASDAGVQLGNLSTITGAAARSARDLGRSRQDVLLFAESVSKGASLANTGTAAVEGAMIQLSQAIASPRVQLQEFNSVVEGTPRLAQAFADGVLGAGSSIAQLRAAIADGEVSGEQLFAGLLSQAEALREEFETLDQGPRQAINRLNNALTEFLGTSEAVKGGAQSLAAAIEFVAENVDVLTNAVLVSGAALTGWLGASAVATVVTGLRNVAVGATAAAQAMAILGRVGTFLGGPWVLAFTAAAGAVTYLAIRAANATDTFEDLNNKVSDIDGSLRDLAESAGISFDAIAEGARQAVEPIDDAIQRIEEMEAALRETGALQRQLAIDSTLDQIGRAQLLVAEAERALRDAENQNIRGGTANFERKQQEIARATEALNRAEQNLRNAYAVRDELVSNTTDEDFKPDTETPPSGRDGDNNTSILRGIQEIENAYRDTFETERQEIERNRQARLAAIEEARSAGVKSESELLRLTEQANAIAERGLQDIAARQAAIEKQKTERAFEALQEQAANEESILNQMLDARDQAMGDYLAIENRQYEHARELIEREIEDQANKNAALLALEEAHAENVRQIKERMQEERLREALYEAQTFEEGFRAQWDVMRSEAESAAADIGVLFAETFGPGGSIQEAIGSAAGRAIAFGDDFQDSMEQAARTIAADLIGALIKYGVQLAIQAALGKAMGASAAGFTAAQGAIIAKAMAPAAAMTSLAMAGANAAPAQFGIASTVGLAKGFAAMPGFEVGGYTGGGGRKDVAGLVHGQEFVNDADSTAMNRHWLERMNSGLNMDEYLKSLTRPIAMSPSIVGGGSSVNSYHFGAPQITISGPVNQDTMPDIRAELQKFNRDFSARVQTEIKRHETRTTPRHQRKKSFK